MLQNKNHRMIGTDAQFKISFEDHSHVKYIEIDILT